MYVVFSALALGLLALDQWLKLWITENLPLGSSMPFLPGLVELHTVHNYGAAWSSFSGQRWLLLGVTACIIVAVAWLLTWRIVRHPLGVAACCLILSGGVGNMIDRIALGYVVDFIDFCGIWSYIFNVADSCVCIGAGMMVLHCLLSMRDEAKAQKNAPPADSDGGVA